MKFFKLIKVKSQVIDKGMYYVYKNRLKKHEKRNAT